MKLSITFLPLIILIIAGCNNKPIEFKQSKYVTSFAQYSQRVKDTFHISVQIPLEYDEREERRYPTIVLLDGNFYFPMMSAVLHQYETAGLLPPMILISVGYDSFKMMDSLRSRDYLYPNALPSDELPAVGDGENFRAYIVEELLPRVDENYRTRREDRALLGHSFGGYFVLYALLRQAEENSRVFKNFISASPPLWYHEFYASQVVDKLKKRRAKNVLNIFLGVGGLEDSTWTVAPVKKLNDELVERNIDAIELQTKVYSELDHMDVGVLTFTKGLQHYYRRRGRP